MPARNVPVRSNDQSDVIPCKRCGSPARVAHGCCLSCVLQQGLECDGENAAEWDEALDEVNVRGTEWRIGNYQILQEIGRGGMGVIYRARQRNSQRIVSLKRILSVHADSRDTLERFRREAVTVASLRHPNILPIYELGETEDGLPFFTMKYAAGGSLLDVAQTLRRDPRRIVRLIAKVTRAMQYAHREGVLHRDLKPGNILLDDFGEPLVSDFGLAKSLETRTDLTRTMTSFGTPGFIAPEQAHGPAKDLSAAADIYGIGALLFYLLAGRAPFVGENALAVIKEASEKTAPRLRTFAPEVDRDLEMICAKCLEREPDARYFSAGELAEDLERWLEGRPIIARRIAAPVRVWQWSKRNPKFAGALAASILLAMLNLVAIFTISHLLSVGGPARSTRHAVASADFQDLREHSGTMKSVTEAMKSLDLSGAPSHSSEEAETVRARTIPHAMEL
ncbi:MAG TPA: serine/threonine-protein kinase [Candidatus Udaeobacter sp.]|nr:serine/threonine-protein kinase [Candidatus Udaeobacter sp.]